MTSEPRPAVEVFRNAVDATGAFVRFKRKSEQAAAAVIQAYGDEREAKGREEQAAELAKFKALAETLAGAMRRIHKTASHPTNPSRNLVDIKFVSDLALHNYDAAMRQYKEARDAS